MFSVQTDGVVLRGLHLTGSGHSHDTDDSCLDGGHRNVLENLVIDNCLFGIDLKQSNNNVLRKNELDSKPVELGVRGDGLGLWSPPQTNEGNEVSDCPGHGGVVSK